MHNISVAMLVTCIAIAGAFTSGCESSTRTINEPAGYRDASFRPDASRLDASFPFARSRDAVDGSTPVDAGTTIDGGLRDAGPSHDAGVAVDGATDASIEMDAGAPDAGGLRCGDIICAPRATECGWEGLDRIDYAVTCITPATEPRCAYPATRTPCDYACAGGRCVAPACTDSTGTVRPDLCDNGIDEDCDLSDCACRTPTYLGDYYETVTLYPGLLLDRDSLDIWTLAADYPGYSTSSTSVRVRNLSGVEVSYTVNGATTRTVETGETAHLSSVATWSSAGYARFSCGGCTSQTLNVGYDNPPEPHARFVGVFAEDDGGTAYPAVAEVQVIPIPGVGAFLPPATTFRECLCRAECAAYIDATLTVELPGGTFTHHSDYSMRFRPELRWDASTEELRISFGSDPPGVSASFAGTPDRMTGSLHDSRVGSPSGALVMRLE